MRQRLEMNGSFSRTPARAGDRVGMKGLKQRTGFSSAPAWGFAPVCVSPLAVFQGSNPCVHTHAALPPRAALENNLFHLRGLISSRNG